MKIKFKVQRVGREVRPLPRKWYWFGLAFWGLILALYLSDAARGMGWWNWLFVAVAASYVAAIVRVIAQYDARVYEYETADAGRRLIYGWTGPTYTDLYGTVHYTKGGK